MTAPREALTHMSHKICGLLAAPASRGRTGAGADAAGAVSSQTPCHRPEALSGSS